MSKTIKYVVLGISAMILIVGAVYFMQSQSAYVRARDAKMETLRLAQQSQSQTMDSVNQQPQTSSNDGTSSSVVDDDTKAVFVRAKSAADAVTEMQMKYPELISKIGISEFDEDEDAKAAIISLREDGLAPYFPEDSAFRESWFMPDEKVGNVKWTAYVASQMNSDYVPVVWLLTDDVNHILVYVSAYYSEATNSFKYASLHWTAYGSNAVAFTGNDDINDDDREVDEFVDSVKELIGISGLGSSKDSTEDSGGSD